MNITKEELIEYLTKNNIAIKNTKIGREHTICILMNKLFNQGFSWNAEYYYLAEGSRYFLATNDKQDIIKRHFNIVNDSTLLKDLMFFTKNKNKSKLLKLYL